MPRRRLCRFGGTSLLLSFSSNTTTTLPVYSRIRAEDMPLSEIDNVYLLDFVGPPGFVQQLSNKVERVVVLDHHKTALEMLGSGMATSGSLIKVIDMDRSGATIAYDYFKEKLLGGDAKDGAFGEFQRVRGLFDYIEDGDLWRWRLSSSKAFSSGLKDLNLEFDVTTNPPSLFQQLLQLDLDSVTSQGMSTLAHKQKIIDEVPSQSYEIALGGGTFGRRLGFHLYVHHSGLIMFRGIGAVVYRVPELENDLLLKVSLKGVSTMRARHPYQRNMAVEGIAEQVHS